METRSLIYLDTHVLVWLYAGEEGLFPEKVLELLEENRLLFSPMVELELQYLFEIGKIAEDGKTITRDLEARIGLERCSQSFENVVSLALRENWTRDPFDRIIVSQARTKSARLITKDRNILKNYSKAVWA